MRGPIERLGGRIEDFELRLVHHGYVSKVAQGESRVARNVALLLRSWGGALVMRGCTITWGLRRRVRRTCGRRRSICEKRWCSTAGRSTSMQNARVVRARADRSREKKNAKAMGNARRALGVDPGNLAALHVLALATFFAGDTRGAAPLFEAVRRSPRCNPTQTRISTA